MGEYERRHTNRNDSYRAIIQRHEPSHCRCHLWTRSLHALSSRTACAAASHPAPQAMISKECMLTSISIPSRWQNEVTSNGHFMNWDTTGSVSSTPADGNSAPI